MQMRCEIREKIIEMILNMSFKELDITLAISYIAIGPNTYFYNIFIAFDKSSEKNKTESLNKSERFYLERRE